MQASERRKEQRFVVDAVQGAFGDTRFAGIGIAASGARVSCSPADYEAVRARGCKIEFERGGEILAFPIVTHVIRAHAFYVVLGYSPPAPNWPEFIRQFDTFHVHELDAQLFDEVTG